MAELDPTAVRSVLRTSWLGRAYHYLPSTSSTSDLLKDQARTGMPFDPPAGTVLLADFQESGRGRLSRRWQAPSGTSLLFSVLLRPEWPPERLAWLPLLCGLAVAQAVEDVTGLDARLKWPNDLVLESDGAWHKVGGILLETAFAQTGQASYTVAGIGVNVNIPRAQLPAVAFPATSLMLAAGRPVSRLALLAAILARLERLYDAAQGGWSPQPAWDERLIMRNQPVTLSCLGDAEALHGVCEGTDDQGRLLLRDAHGRVHTIAAGDLSLRPQNNA